MKYCTPCLVLLLITRVYALRGCKLLSTDLEWPSEVLWNNLNASIDGRLIKTIPIGSSCHNPTFDTIKCSYIRNNWHETSLHLPSSSSVMTPFFTNRSCDPFTSPDDPCVIGTYVQYSVNVSTIDHVMKTMSFAKQHNVRFVVRNTGHDYMGKSTGTSGLAVWLHYIQNIQWIERYVSPLYKGPAIKAYAGASVEDIYKVAAAKKHTVVGGDCRSVGFTGGYIQGGGHSVLTSLLGLAADSVLQYEVITTQGTFVTASPTQNADLYWALSGGGGGTYGIVWSVTVIAHSIFSMTVGNISFTSKDVSQDAYWEAIKAFQIRTPGFTDKGISAVLLYSSSAFTIGPLVAPKLSASEVTDILKPWFDRLQTLGITVKTSISSHSDFLDAYHSTGFRDIQVGIQQFGGWLLPRSLFQEVRSLEKTMQVIRNIADQEGLVYDIVLRPPSGSKLPHTASKAVLPAWRESQKFLITLLPWSDTATQEQIIQDRKKITIAFDGPLRNLAAESGTYLNEADADEPDWQHAFYGSNYDRLLRIKDKWDPDELLYGATAVGGDRWFEDQEGRLCKVR